VLHAVHVSFYTDPQARQPEQLLRDWPTLVDVAEAAAGSGTRISVVQASQHTRTLQRNAVNYHFFPFGEGSKAARNGNASLTALVGQLRPDVFHVHGLGFPRDVVALAAAMPAVPIVIQDHANPVPRLWRRPTWRRGLRAAAGVSFCSRAQAEPFARAGLIHPPTRVFEVPEATSPFTPGERDRAREITGVTGNPALLWVGHLDSNKDPLTVLDGVAAAVEALPELRLWCCFGTAPLLREVQDRISQDAALRNRVHLLGRVDHPQIESMMRAADLFVLGSHHEGSGYSLIEALACGLAPAVTDIPSFRSLTGNGAIGVLWPPGDPRGLTRALIGMAQRPPTREAVRAHFDKELSAAALGHKLSEMYREVAGRQTDSLGKRVSGLVSQGPVEGPVEG
jgi:glycosyltransferase involved in cell wall biosynthesis